MYRMWIQDTGWVYASGLSVAEEQTQSPMVVCCLPSPSPPFCPSRRMQPHHPSGQPVSHPCLESDTCKLNFSMVNVPVGYSFTACCTYPTANWLAFHTKTINIVNFTRKQSLVGHVYQSKDTSVEFYCCLCVTVWQLFSHCLVIWDTLCTV